MCFSDFFFTACMSSVIYWWPFENIGAFCSNFVLFVVKLNKISIILSSSHPCKCHKTFQGKCFQVFFFTTYYIFLLIWMHFFFSFVLIVLVCLPSYEKKNHCFFFLLHPLMVPSLLTCVLWHVVNHPCMYCVAQKVILGVLKLWTLVMPLDVCTRSCLFTMTILSFKLFYTELQRYLNTIKW